MEKPQKDKRITNELYINMENYQGDTKSKRKKRNYLKSHGIENKVRREKQLDRAKLQELDNLTANSETEKQKLIKNNKCIKSAEKFVYVKSTVKFEELPNGKIKCGGCKKEFTRILGHLNKKNDCDKDIDLEEFKACLSKFGARKRTSKYEHNLKQQDMEQFLKVKADGNRKCYKKQKAENPDLFLKGKAVKTQEQRKNKDSKIDADKRIVRFRKATRFGPIFECRCCERKLFEHQVVEVDIESFKEKVEEKKQGIFSQCIRSHRRHSLYKDIGIKELSGFELNGKNFVCKGCKVSLERGKMPKMCSNNGLTVDVLPDNLILAELENNLIAKNIIFQKLHKKPKSRWSGTHDRLVNIPIGDQDIINTVTNFPRTPAEAGIITVKLKRKLEYKNTHTEQLIDTKKIYKYLHYLKHVAKNKRYQFLMTSTNI